MKYYIYILFLTCFISLNTNLFSQSNEVADQISILEAEKEEILSQQNIEQQSEVYFKLSIEYFELGLFSKSIKIIEELSNQAEKYGFIDLYIRAQMRLASLWHQTDSRDNALIHYDKIAKDLNKTKDLFLKINGLNALANAHEIRNQLDSSMAIYNEGLDLINANPGIDSTGGLRATIYSNITMLITNQASRLKTVPDDSVFYYLNKAKSYIKNDTGIIHSNLINLHAGVYFAQKKYQESIHYYYESLKASKKSNFYDLYLNSLAGLSKNYEKLNQLDSALYYAKQFIFRRQDFYSDKEEKSLSGLKNHYKIKEEQYKLDLKEKELDKKLAQNELKQTTNIFIIAVLSVALLSLIIISFVIRARNRKNSELLIVQKKLIETEKNNLKNEVKLKESDITNLVLEINRKSEFSKSILEEIKSLKRSPDITKSNIKSLELFIKNQTLNEKSRALIMDKINEVNSAFEKRLNSKFPNLTKGEIRLCKYSRLNLSIKDVAALKNISETSVNMSRYRLRKKLGLKHEESLHEFMKDI